jgi:uncharacterized C2H2 Zn-finger protein
VAEWWQGPKPAPEPGEAPFAYGRRVRTGNRLRRMAGLPSWPRAAMPERVMEERARPPVRDPSPTDPGAHPASAPPASPPDRVPYRAVRDFHVAVGGTIVLVRAGEILDDPHLLERVDLSHAPVAPLDGSRWAVCPRCGHRFEGEPLPDRPVYRVYRGFTVRIGHAIVSFTAGQLVSDAYVTQQLDEATQPIVQADDAVVLRCPRERCGHVFHWEC